VDSCRSNNRLAVHLIEEKIVNPASLLNSKKEMYVGGELELQSIGEEGLPAEILRGPIADIRAEGQELVFTFNWLASMKVGTGVWKLADNQPIKFHALALKLGDIGSNRLFSALPHGVVTIFPKDGSKLSPDRVTPNPEDKS
jgi:hypothetical protein